MIDQLNQISLAEVKAGYRFDGKYYRCHFCDQAYGEGEVFQHHGQFYLASKMIEIHIAQEHGGMLEVLTSHNKKYTGLTDNQKELIKMISEGMTDQEIAQRTGVSPVTIRHQRYTLREKAKQAKLYLAIYELAMEGAEERKKAKDESHELIEVHEFATMVDERYVVTKGEEEKILKTMFESLAPLKLKNFSSKEKKKLVILRRISQEFSKNKVYHESEVNGILKEIYEDYVTLRRYLIEYGFMERTKDGKEYRLK